MQKTTIRSILMLLLLGLIPIGCRSYQPDPLAPDVHRREWLERSPSSDGVQRLAERLAAEDATIEAYDPTDGLTLAEAELIALVFNPELRLARLEVGVAQATADHAGLWDDPEFAIDVLRITESVASPWVITPGLAFTIPLSGRLEVEKSRADAALCAELTRVAEAEWRIRHQVRKAWIAWSAVVMKTEETTRLIDGMERLTRSTERLADAGELPRTEATLFVIERSRRRQERTRLEGDAEAGAQRLRMLLGLSTVAPLELVPSIEVGGPTNVPDDILASSLRLRHLQETYQVAEHELHLEIRKQYPDLTIGPLYETDQGQSRIGFLGAIPLPVFNGNRRGIATANARRELARAAFETAIEELEGALAIARVRERSLMAQYEELAEGIAPMVDRQLEDATRLVELGEGGGLVLLESLVLAQDTKLDMIDLRRELATASAEARFLKGPAWQDEDRMTNDNEEGTVNR